ncbi:RNA polymerase sigma factor [Pedobacter psychroterrae]|uniref:Sigma-70 family RNA polymerase sigma factor n=1 Tax=Pedobacter psychroterrae TaxID=2530453 RepID=A0A4R0NU76_9SPHI|nr:sigma-70 family RNA polymerase sigma factor [Pedobacter psychroterrae]TCD03025.1 sigma-70 family RNA polymerase sigma factor [Pedobacter psychroterrae]
MQQKLTDQDLISAVLAGNTKVYAELVKRHERFVFTLALRFVKKREDAEEVAQDCFVKAYRALGTFSHHSKFSTWLYTITYTTAMTFLRKKQLDTQSIDDEETGIQLENQLSSYDANEIERKSAYVYLNQAIALLLPNDAAIITMFYQGEQSLEEISQVLKTEPNTVKVKLHRARARLKEKMQLILKDEVKELL